MYYLKLSLLLSVFIIAPSVHAMDFYQKAMQRDQKGIDLRAVIPLEDQYSTLQCGAQRRSMQELFDDYASDTDNPLNTALLYILEEAKIVSRGSMADCINKQELLAMHGKGLYAVYTKRGNALRILLLGTSDSKDLVLLTQYLIFKSSQTKENGGCSTNMPRTSGSLSRPVLACLPSKYNEDSVV